MFVKCAQVFVIETDPTNSIKVLKEMLKRTNQTMKTTKYTYTQAIIYTHKIDWLSMVLRLRQHNIGYTADGFL